MRAKLSDIIYADEMSTHKNALARYVYVQLKSVMLGNLCRIFSKVVPVFVSPTDLVYVLISVNALNFIQC